ncbi:DUF4097 family beta strand repeat-containing protein [Glycomyces terrestris]|uniref:DUF4097 domain-containing protein n=1 Tax=Glycomyces terrestris TaxID=2493553 RepID=A0A426UY89_9ACTN|nr:DUF4097 family beta strand repeat-containing protein [Glycomyces terrestris]RRR99535.1 hypothetical protein EIW28_12595 [Glycomyces terrestris]
MIDTPVKPATADTPDEPAYPARKAWWIVGGAVTGAALLTGLLAFGSWAWMISSSEEDATRTEEFDRAVAAAEVRAEVGDLRFEAAAGTALEFRLKTQWLGAAPDTSEEWDGDRFSAEGECDQGRFLGLDVDQCETDYTLGLPAGADATAETGVGDVSLDGLDGAVDIDTGIGDVTGEGLRTTDTTVVTGVGDVTLEFAQVLGDISVEAGTGDVVLTVPDDGTVYEVLHDGGIGDQHIEIATDPTADADYTITVASGVGSLTIQYGS